MKKILLICLIAVTALVGCKKDDNESKTSNDKLIGKWMAKTEIEFEYENGKLVRQEDPSSYDTDEYVIEFTGTQIKQYEFGESIEEPYNYTVSGDKINYTEDGNSKFITIKSQSDKNLVLLMEDVDVINGVTFKEVLEISLVKK
ncbi:MAG: lipocalin family protein [Bacteroidota bacterium]